MKRSSPPPSTSTTSIEPQSKRDKLDTMPSTLPSPASVATFLVQRHSDKARIPTRGSALAAGYDLYSSEEKTVPARGQALIGTDISIAIPEGTYGRVAPRSGLGVKHSITTGAGVIDADYRGKVGVLLFNLGDKDFEIKEGDRIAQLILEKIVTPEPQEVSSLDETVRGAGGFGSTGGFGVAVPPVTEAEKK
ncbi:bifunctional dITP/dUTP diphosphatase [Sporobolomyces salmoneus]|uniref:bifunctional dITP/dUTP diphosphatase n=1 Tax=Sporobolomyces salmoneus TaxID=183962 RepID=UPI0031757729